jgi:pSer/pThr/pTyr-binding forkhead associated (FHA) protein
VGDPGADFCKFCGARYADGKAAEPVSAAHVAKPPVEPTVTAPSRAVSAPGAAPVAVAMAAPAPAPAAAPYSPALAAVPSPALAPQPEPRAHATVVEAGPLAHAEPLARLVAILKDGSDGRVFPLTTDQTDIGRLEGDVVLSDDPYLSPRHARIARRGSDWILRDLDSVNGVFVRIREPVDIVDGDMLLAGQQVLKFELLPDAELPLGPASISGVLVFGTPEAPRYARLTQYTTEGVGRDVHYLYRDETVLGRENGDIVFTDDPFLSRRHASITVDRAARRYVLRDLGSSNGTSLRFRGERVLGHGDQFRVGRHLFRFDRLDGGKGAR